MGEVVPSGILAREVEGAPQRSCDLSPWRPRGREMGRCPIFMLSLPPCPARAPAGQVHGRGPLGLGVGCRERGGEQPAAPTQSSPGLGTSKAEGQKQHATALHATNFSGLEIPFWDLPETEKPQALFWKREQLGSAGLIPNGLQAGCGPSAGEGAPRAEEGRRALSP